jgi:hypothetical protein
VPMKKILVSVAVLGAMGACNQPVPQELPHEVATADLSRGGGEGDPLGGLSPDLRNNLEGMEGRIKSSTRDPSLIQSAASFVVADPDAFGNTWIRTTYRIRGIPNNFITDVFFFPQGGYEAFYRVVKNDGQEAVYFRESVNNPSAPSDPWADKSGMMTLATMNLNKTQIERVAAARTAFWSNQAFLDASGSAQIFNDDDDEKTKDKIERCKNICLWSAIAAGFASGLITTGACEGVAFLIGGPGAAIGAARGCGAVGAAVGGSSGTLVSAACTKKCDEIGKQKPQMPK